MSLINKVLDDLSQRHSSREMGDLNLQEMGVKPTRASARWTFPTTARGGALSRPLGWGVGLVLLLGVGMGLWNMPSGVPLSVPGLLAALGLPETVWRPLRALFPVAPVPVVQGSPTPSTGPSAGVVGEKPPVKMDIHPSVAPSGSAVPPVTPSATPPATSTTTPSTTPPAAVDATAAPVAATVSPPPVPDSGLIWRASYPVMLPLPSESEKHPSKKTATSGQQPRPNGKAKPAKPPVSDSTVSQADARREPSDDSAQRTARTAHTEEAIEKNRADTVLSRARAALIQGDLSRTGDILQEVPPALTDTVDYLTIRAAWHQQSGDFAQAAESYRHLIERETERGRWWLGMAISLERLGQSHEAAAAYLEAEAHRDLDGSVRRFVRERLAKLSQQEDHP